MYAYIKGKVTDVQPDHTVVDCSGIGYLIYTTIAVYTDAQIEGKETLFYTSFQVREDSMRLFGFLQCKEKELFEKLLTISGLGPKTAMAIVGAGASIDLPKAILEKNALALTKIPGIGKKTAERIIVELADKVGSLAKSSKTPSSTIVTDAAAALVSLGFKEKEARERVEAAFENADPKVTLSSLIALSLSRTKTTSN